MFIYAGGRRSGKTGKMIEWFLGDPSNRIILTPNMAQANYLIRRIKSSMDDGFPYYNHIMPFEEARQYIHRTHNYQIGIENLDMVLYAMLSNTVEFATVTGVKIESTISKPWWRFW